MSTIATVITTIASIITALTVIFTVPKAIINARDKHIEKERLQKEQNEKQDNAIKEIQKQQAHIREEQTLICYAVTACLDGLHQQGCNGNVTDALNHMNKYLNVSAHK